MIKYKIKNKEKKNKKKKLILQKGVGLFHPCGCFGYLATLYSPNQIGFKLAISIQVQSN